MSVHQVFTFEDYSFDTASKTLELHYSIDDALHFTETYRFDFDFVEYDPALLERALENLFFMAGVSYYKTYVPPEIAIQKGRLGQTGAAFFGKTYQRGLGEFWYVNQLDPDTPVTFPATDEMLPIVQATPNDGLLVGVGGGKDSLVTIEGLRSYPGPVTTWSLGHRAQLAPLVERIGLPHLWVERTWDKQLLELNTAGALNGHVPISAIFACVGSIVAILSGRRDVIVSNEQAANEPTLHYRGTAINHQYSKSQEFERDYQAYAQTCWNDAVRYYSFLRPLSELRIGELFAKGPFATYRDVFSSCNRAFTHTSDHMFWCGECPKCAFIFMILTPFVEQHELEAIWHGKNLLHDPSLEPVYRQLLGIEGDKPLECVGEIKESRAAMRLCQAIYPDLREKYVFELPEDYDYRALGTDEMPVEIRPYLKKLLSL